MAARASLVAEFTNGHIPQFLGAFVESDSLPRLRNENTVLMTVFSAEGENILDARQKLRDLANRLPNMKWALIWIDNSEKGIQNQERIRTKLENGFADNAALIVEEYLENFFGF